MALHRGGKITLITNTASQREIENLERSARRKYNISASLKGIEPGVGHRAIRGLDDLFIDYPKMKGYFKFLTTLTNRTLRTTDDSLLKEVKRNMLFDMEDMMVCSSNIGGNYKFGISINPTNFGSMRQAQGILNDMVKWGSMPKGCNSIEALIAHEFGHGLLHFIMDDMDDEELVSVSVALHSTKLHDVLTDAVFGGYERDPEEIWADAFSALHFTPPELIEDSPLIKTVEEVLDNHRHVYI